MSDEVLEALLSGENQEVGDLTGVPEVTGDEVLEQLEPEKALEAEPVETEQPEVVDENPNNFLDALKAMDIEAESAYGLQVPMQDEDGNQVFKSVGELKDAYKESQSVLTERERTTQELVARQTELQQQQDSFLTQRAELLQMPQQIQDVESRLYAVQQYIGQNREELTRSNPSALALAEQEQASLTMTRDNLNMQTYNLRQQQQDALKNQQSIRDMQHKQKQEEILVKIVPEWVDGEVRKAETLMLIDHLKDNGFSDERINTLTEAMDIKYLLENARRAQAIKGVKAKVDAPKPLKPQAVKAKSTVERAALNQLFKKATDSRDSRDKIDGIVALLSQ